MPVTYRDARIDTTLAASAISITTPQIEDGDLLLAFVAVADVGVEAATLTTPSGWRTLSTTTNGSVRLFVAFRYVDDASIEPVEHLFTYSAVRPLIGAISVYEGVRRDLTHDPVTYPYGYFAPDGSLGGVRTGTGTTIQSAVTSTISTQTYTRTVTFFVGHNVSTPLLDDVSPLVPVRAISTVARVGDGSGVTSGFAGHLAAVLVDEELETTINPLNVRSVAGNISMVWVSATVVLEPVVSLASSFDNYKTKMLRSFMPAPYDAGLSTPLGQLLAVIGRADNDIGGLFGSDDFRYWCECYD